MNKSLLIIIAAAVAAVGIWFGIQSRQGAVVEEPVVETAPEPVLVEPEPEVAEPEVTPTEEPEVAPAEDTFEGVEQEATETVEEAIEGSVDATAEPVDTSVGDIIGDDAQDAGSAAAVDEAATQAETGLSPEAATEAADAVEEQLELQDLGLDVSVDAIRAQIADANLTLADRGIIEGLLQAAGDNPDLLQQVVDRLRQMTGN